MAKGLDSPKSMINYGWSLVQDGFGWVARYYFDHSGFKQVLTHDEALHLSQMGIWMVSIWENGYPTTDGYFTAQQGHNDASRAVECAIAAGQPEGTVIYFAVDGDVIPADVDDYFQAINQTLIHMGGRYTAGVYGSGDVCERMKAKGYVTHTWLTQSKGWRGYENAVNKENIVQGAQTLYHGIDVDMDVSDGAAGGWKIAA